MHKNNPNEPASINSEGSVDGTGESLPLGKRKFVAPEISNPIEVREVTNFFFQGGTPVTDSGNTL
jgi:hypothetical protein